MSHQEVSKHACHIIVFASIYVQDKTGHYSHGEIVWSSNLIELPTRTVNNHLKHRFWLKALALYTRSVISP